MTLVGEYADLLHNGKIHFVQPDLGRVGGITGALAIARLANDTGARAVPHAYAPACCWPRQRNGPRRANSP